MFVKKDVTFLFHKHFMWVRKVEVVRKEPLTGVAFLKNFPNKITGNLPSRNLSLIKL